MSENKSNQKRTKNTGRFNDNIAVILKQLAKPFCFLLIFIMICAFLAHYLTGSETLTEYARNHPEQAYGTDDPDAFSGKDNADSTAGTAENNGSGTVNSGINTETGQNNELPGSNTESGQNNELPGSNTASGQNNGTSGIDSAYTTDKNTAAESEQMDKNVERTTYQPGFFYEPLTDSVKRRITGISYPETGCTVPYEDLNYVSLLYIDFNGEKQQGELICNKAVAQDMVEIFYELYQNEYQIERIRLVDEYDGDDTASMADNNTSCFNYRVVDGTASLSNHAYGLAIDINPFYNPYVVFNRGGAGSTYISPPGSEIYADRSQDFAYKIDEKDLCYRLFTEHGFTWGGNWNSSKDYQHFQKKLD